MIKNIKDRQKFLLSDIDHDKPFRITAPSFSVSTTRAETKEEALKLFESISQEGHQAILTFIDVVQCKVRILNYSPPSKKFKRKE